MRDCGGLDKLCGLGVGVCWFWLNGGTRGMYRLNGRKVFEKCGKVFESVGKWDGGDCDGSVRFRLCRKEEWLWRVKWG
jgi:hypothetical protein